MLSFNFLTFVFILIGLSYVRNFLHIFIHDKMQEIWHKEEAVINPDPGSKCVYPNISFIALKRKGQLRVFLTQIKG